MKIICIGRNYRAHAEELGNGAWFGTPSGNSPMPYIGGFND